MKKKKRKPIMRMIHIKVYKNHMAIEVKKDHHTKAEAALIGGWVQQKINVAMTMYGVTHEGLIDLGQQAYQEAVDNLAYMKEHEPDIYKNLIKAADSFGEGIVVESTDRGKLH